MYYWLLIAEMKRFLLPFQSNPGLNKEMGPELITVLVPRMLRVKNPVS